MNLSKIFFVNCFIKVQIKLIKNFSFLYLILRIFGNVFILWTILSLVCISVLYLRANRDFVLVVRAPITCHWIFIILKVRNMLRMGFEFARTWIIISVQYEVHIHTSFSAQLKNGLRKARVLHYTRMELVAKSKCSCLLGPFTSYKENEM